MRRRKVLKRNLSVWRRRIFVVLVAAVCTFVIGLLSHSAKLVESSVPQASPVAQQQTNSGLEVSDLKAAIESQVKALTKEIGRLDQHFSSFFVPKEFQGKTIAETTLSPQQKVIALTFDDGPWPRTTKQVLDILEQNDIKATFFWIGNNLKNFPEIAKLVVTSGHTIGNHTWHHWYKRMDAATAAREIEDTAELIYKITGLRTSLFRPPGGILNNGPADYAKKKNYAVMTWSADSKDWFYRFAPAQVLVHNVLKEAESGGIVLMHDGGGDRSKTVKALPQIIDGLRKRGYRFVTIPELLEMKDQELKLTNNSP